MSCRLYRGADGRVQGAPTAEDLRWALDGAGRAAADGQGLSADLDVLDPVGRGGRGRLAPAERGLRSVQQHVLRHFAQTGTAPSAADLEPVAARFGRSAAEVLAELAAEDFLTLDETGGVRAAYPFSAAPTAHRVAISGGAQVWSMCAIDALGIPAMLDADAVITSSDPVTGETVTVTSTGGRMVWEPAGAVVFVGRRCCAGPAATVCCDVLNVFTSGDCARRWAQDHADIIGRVLDQSAAEQLGVQTLGPLLGRAFGADVTTAGPR
ncbi:alkylmercury lyase-like protein [Streptomyces sp. 846.5]|nr:alkylmercury lyase family protein [Streptomyces sp. 846.5]TDU05121.1 alkylmercury lyase-like protein [Streptomyces sp. 846.5]